MISCKCMTAGRIHLLEESLYSFLHLRYEGKKELIIVNDYPYQELVFEHPEVKIFNFKELFPSIGEKDIFSHDQCQGDIYKVWDDDDIALPHHLTHIDHYLEDNDLLHWDNAGLYDEYPTGKRTDKPRIQFCGVGNSGIVYTREAYEKAGKSPIMNEGYDRVLVGNIRNLRNKVALPHPENKDISWLYRWSSPVENGVGNYHLSGGGDFVEGRDDVRIRNFNYLEDLRKRGKLPVGRIKLQPKWRHNYVEMLKSFL